jgi:hypothetical protein
VVALLQDPASTDATQTARPRALAAIEVLPAGYLPALIAHRGMISVEGGTQLLQAPGM